MTPRDRRALWIAAITVAFVVTVRLAQVAVRWTVAALDEARQATLLSERAGRVVADAPVRRSLMRERARDIVALAPLLLAGVERAEAEATLAGELNALAARQRLVVTRLDPAPDTARGGLTPIEVRLHAEGDIAGIYGLVHAVENGALLLTFGELVISATDGAAPVERLRLDAAVRGWMVTPQSARRPGAER